MQAAEEPRRGEGGAETCTGSDLLVAPLRLAGDTGEGKGRARLSPLSIVTPQRRVLLFLMPSVVFILYR